MSKTFLSDKITITRDQNKNWVICELERRHSYYELDDDGVTLVYVGEWPTIKMTVTPDTLALSQASTLLPNKIFNYLNS